MVTHVVTKTYHPHILSKGSLSFVISMGCAMPMEAVLAPPNGTYRHFHRTYILSHIANFRKDATQSQFVGNFSSFLKFLEHRAQREAVAFC